MKRKEMGKVKRPEIVHEARRIGRADAMKKRYESHMKCFLYLAHLMNINRDMVAGSKRRTEKEKESTSIFTSAMHDDSEDESSS